MIIIIAALIIVSVIAFTLSIIVIDINKDPKFQEKLKETMKKKGITKKKGGIQIFRIKD